MSFAVGSLVRARGREWVVQPETEGDLLILRPLGGSDVETTGVYTPLEPVVPATFEYPDAGDLGDFHSCRRLRDAARLANRNSAGPFRCAGNLNVEPRPYQLVPLLLALRQDPVRLLIADDVGIGKTVEACLIARELLDRGEIRRLCVLCPPHLAEQWQSELREKFNVPAERLLPSTVTRLERKVRGVGQSVFDVYPFLVVSTDYIKSDRRRSDFLRACPEMVIVDEAHTCVPGSAHARTAHLRHQLLRGLVESGPERQPERHLLLVTATPHSGKEESFRALLTLLSPELAELPEDLTGPGNEGHRRRLSEFFVQRRRGDIQKFLGEETPFPTREEPDKEPTYALHPEYRKFFDKVLRFARETVRHEGEDRVRSRVRWWSALALLRSVSSSPAAAAATLRSRMQSAEAETPEEADELGRRAVLDLMDEESPEGMDVTPGSDPGEEPGENGETGDDGGDGGESPTRRRLRAMAREVEKLTGDKDRKLVRATELIRELLDDGFQPLVFCRFIPTAEYVAEQLRERLHGAEVAAITGTIPPEEREKRVLALAQADPRVLVCTDCLSEGINLQAHFDAVVHYDLSWSPTRHEQREGRVDRFNQPKDVVRVLTYYGSDNPIDGIVLDVLLRKHKAIRSSLGVAVPVPTDTDQVVEAIFEGLLLREEGSGVGLEQMTMFEDLIRPEKERLHNEWEEAAERHRKQSKTMFAQQRIKPETVKAELQAAREAVGSGDTVHRFTLDALEAHGALVAGDDPYRIDLAESPVALRDRLPGDGELRASFELPVAEGVVHLHRTHPMVQGLADHVFDSALDPELEGIAHRTGVTRTSGVSERTVLLLTRLRFQLVTRKREDTQELLAEECRLFAFTGDPEEPQWLDDPDSAALLEMEPEANVPPDQASHFLRTVLNRSEEIDRHLETRAAERGEELLEAHQRVRRAAKARGVRYQVEPKLPVDVLGLYLYLPA